MPAITVKAGERNVLNVLGMPLWFLCDADETEGAWSLMEEEISLGLGPPPHRHDWDEAYYVIEGALDFEIDGKSVRIEAGDFAYLPRNTVHAFKGGVAVSCASAHFCRARSFFRVLQRCESGGPYHS